VNAQPEPDEPQFRGLAAEVFNPNDPRLQTAVVEVLQGHLADVFTRVCTELENAGFNEAAAFVRTNFGS
jgi:hypothetical protein